MSDRKTLIKGNIKWSVISLILVLGLIGLLKIIGETSIIGNIISGLVSIFCIAFIINNILLWIRVINK